MQPPRRPRFRRLALTAAAAMVVGAAGSAWAVAASGSPVLTTAQIVAKTNPAVVDVVSTLGFQNATSAGTGIVLTPSGEVLTNNHVIDGATSIRVRDVGNGHVYRASVVGYDASHDVAVLQLHGASGLATASIGDSGQVRARDKVVAVGNAGGRDGTPSVATGKVTGLNQAITASDASSGSSEQLQGLIQTNADIQPGDSGGPLVNSRGQVIGIDTAASANAGMQLRSDTTTQAYTIPINKALSIARQIQAGAGSDSVHIGATAFLGIQVASSGAGLPGQAAGAGAGVAGVLPGSAAAQAGLSAGDTITAINGRSIDSASAVRAALVRSHPGDKINVSWTDQAGQSHSATVVLAAGPAD